MKTKQCRRCYGIKKKSEFHKCSRQDDGLQTWCKICINEYKVQWRENKRTPEQQEENNRQNENRELVKTGIKKCATCQIVKPLTEFWKGGTGSKVNIRGSCAECQQTRNSANRGCRDDKRNKNQRGAAARIHQAIQSGKIDKPDKCSLCGSSPVRRTRSRIEFHHTNGYDKENLYTGIFVCSHCHHAIHNGKIENVVGTKYA